MPLLTLAFATILSSTFSVAPPDRRAPNAPEKRPASGGVAGLACCRGDLNSDGVVDGSDLALLLGNWGGTGIGDLDGNDPVTGADLSILLGAWGPCVIAPGNDHCNDAYPAYETFYNYFCTLGADIDGPSFASGDCTIAGYNQIDHDVWFDYQAPADGQIALGICNPGWDTRMAVYGSTIPGLIACPTSGLSFATLLGCNDDAGGACGFGSALWVNVEKNEHYKIRIGGYQGYQGEGFFALNFIPAGWDCENAIKITNPASATILNDNIQQFGTPDTANCVTGDGASVWYWFTPPCNLPGANMTVSLCNPGTDFDTVVTIWKIGPSGTCAQTLVACNDDSLLPGCQIGGLNRKSRVSFETDPGWIYYIQVSGFLMATGHFEMKVTLDSCP